MYYTPDKATSVNEVGGGKIWTVEDDKEDDDLTGNVLFWLHFLIASYLKKYWWILEAHKITLPSWGIYTNNIHPFNIFWLVGVDELDDEETRILLEKEFDDFYEDQVHKSAGISKHNIEYGVDICFLHFYIYTFSNII